MLDIPDPCKEDFSKMNATERGAFCGKCKIDTFDFRQLSDNDVNRLLFQHKDEHLCGRFTTSQLSSLNRGYMNWKNQKYSTFKSKFVLALVLVFGLSLFSCDQTEADTLNSFNAVSFTRTNSKLDFVRDIMNNEDFNLTDYTTDTIVVDSPPACQNYEIDGEITIPDEVSFIPEPFVPEILGGIPTKTRDNVQGALVAPTYEMYLMDTIGFYAPERKIVSNQISTIHFETSAYPNPTQNQSTIRVDVKVADQFTVMLYDMNGRLIESVYSGRLNEGIQEFRINLAAQQSGIYLIKVESRGQNETVKLKKLT